MTPTSIKTLLHGGTPAGSEVRIQLGADEARLARRLRL